MKRIERRDKKMIFQDQKEDRDFNTIYKKAKRKPLHIVSIETTESIGKNTATTHASLHNLFQSIEFKKDTRIIVNSDLEIHQFVSSDLVLQVEIKRK